MSEGMRIQSQLAADLEVYRAKGELIALRAENARLRRAVNELVGCFIEGGKPNLAEMKAALQPERGKP